jgi:hypothetical protein
MPCSVQQLGQLSSHRLAPATDPLKSRAQVSSLLRPGGVFFGVAPDADIILHTLGGSDEVTMQPPEVPFVLRLKRLRDAAKAGGGGEGTRGNEGDAKGAGGR